MQVRLAVRYLAGRKLRTFLTTLAVMFGVTIIFGLNGILPGFVQTFRQTLTAATGEVDMSVTAASGGSFSPDVADRVARVDGVASVAPSIRRKVALPPDAYPISSLTVVGVDTVAVGSVRSFPVDDGRFIEAGDTNAIVLAAQLAEDFGVGVGDAVRIPTAEGVREYEVVGTLRLPVVPGSEGVYMPLGSAEAVFGMSGEINAVDVAFEPSADGAKVGEEVAEELGSGYTTGDVDNTQLFSSLRISQVILNLFAVFALAMGAFIILNTFRTIVSERRRDIGMLRAVGASRGTILGMFFVESVVQGVLGTVAGLLAGWGMALGLTALLEPYLKRMLNITVHLEPDWPAGVWAAAIGLGVGVTVLAAVVPAFAAARITPLDALRPRMGDVAEKAATRRTWVGVVLLVLAVVGLLTGDNSFVSLSAVLFLVSLVLVTPAITRPVTNVYGRLVTFVFAREGDIARANLQRNPGRAAVTASTMMVSIAIVVALLGVMTSIFDGFMGYVDKSLGADYVMIPDNLVLSAGNVGISPEVVREIRDVDGVSDVATIRLGATTVAGAKVQVLGVDPDEYTKVASFEYAEGTSQDDLNKLAEGRSVLVNGVYAAQNGVEKGDVLTMQTPEGERDYTVAGVGSDYLNAKLATTYVSQANLERDFSATKDLVLMANVAAGADSAAVGERLDAIMEDFPQFQLYDAASFRAEQIETFEGSMVVMYVLVFALGFPSLIALLNTLAIGVLARTREIGMLRAVGSLRRQVRRMVVAESLLLAALGTSLGILAGIWLAYVFASAMSASGFTIPYYFPWSGILAALAVGLAFGVFASLIPARQAAKLRVVDALRYE